MPQEVGTILRAGYPYNAIVWPGPTLVPATVTALTNTPDYDSGYVLLKNTSRIPYMGAFLAINLPGPISSTGATGSSTMTATITGSNDGVAAAGGSHVAATINVSYTASVGTVTNTNAQGVATGVLGTMFYFRLPEIRHPYIRVVLHTVLTTITACNYGNVGVAVQDDVDTEANNYVDLG